MLIDTLSWATYGTYRPRSSGSPAVNAAKPSGTPIAQVAPANMPRICFSFNAGQWVASPVCPAAQAANFRLLDLQLTEADRRPFKLPLARRKILEYTTDKLAGVYGGSPTQRRRFFARLSIKEARRATPELGGLSRVSL